MGNIIIPFGKDAVLYYGDAGSQPLAKEFYFAGIKDLTVTMEKDEADASRRAYPGWHDQRVGMKNLRLAFDVAGVTVDEVGAAGAKEVGADNGIDLLRALYLTDLYNGIAGIALYARSTGVQPAAADDYVGEGIWGDFLCTKFDRNEPLGDLQSYSVEMVMTLIHGTTPTWSDADPV